MHPILFTIGSVTIYTHGIMAVLGIIVGTVVLYSLAKRVKLSRAYLIDNVIYAVLFGIIGARLAYFFLYRNQFKSFSEIYYLWDGGLVSYGGFILGGIALYFLLRSQNQPKRSWFDVLSIGFAVGLILGRIGNLFAGEYAGFYTTSRFNIGGYIPVTLLEAIWLAIVAAFLYIFFDKIRQIKEGFVFLTFAFLYGSGRFVIDFWRDEKNHFIGLSIGQITSLLIAIAALTLILYTYLKSRKEVVDETIKTIS